MTCYIMTYYSNTYYSMTCYSMTCYSMTCYSMTCYSMTVTRTREKLSSFNDATVGVKQPEKVQHIVGISTAH